MKDKPTKPNGTLVNLNPKVYEWKETKVYWDIVDNSVWLFYSIFSAPIKSVDNMDEWKSKGYEFKPLPSEAVKELKPQNTTFQWPDYWTYSTGDVEVTEVKDVEGEKYVFKVGDKVKSENPKIICSEFKGEVGEVVGIREGDHNVLDIQYTDGTYQTGWVEEDGIVLVERAQGNTPFKWLTPEWDEFVTVANADVSDNVKHPNHYNQDGEIECIDAIKASLGLEGFAAYCRGNTIKYLWRYKRKGGVEDLKKSQQYLTWLIETEEEISKCSSQQ